MSDRNVTPWSADKHTKAGVGGVATPVRKWKTFPSDGVVTRDVPSSMKALFASFANEQPSGDLVRKSCVHARDTSYPLMKSEKPSPAGIASSVQPRQSPLTANRTYDHAGATPQSRLCIGSAACVTLRSAAAIVSGGPVGGTGVGAPLVVGATVVVGGAGVGASVDPFANVGAGAAGPAAPWTALIAEPSNTRAVAPPGPFSSCASSLYAWCTIFAGAHSLLSFCVSVPSFCICFSVSRQFHVVDSSYMMPP
mmetsp:Transcript_10/g.32  ORF Transcript_10/g.32 Transcript_10/m.32 type:complete len:252 (-) Transcript_10:889-1644(-)